MMGTADPALDHITAQLQRENERRRRLTLKLASIPILAGFIVTASAFWSVYQAQQSVASARLAKADLDTKIAQLSEDKATLDAAIVTLDQQLSEKQQLFNRLEQRLPARERQEVALMEKGLDLARAGESSQAIGAYKDALDINPQSALAYTWQGAAYLQQGQHAAAIESLRAALALEPRLAEAHYNLALALWARNDRQAALGEFRKAFQLDPELRLRAHRDPAYRGVRDFADTIDGAGSARTENEKTLIDAGLAAAKQGRMADAIKAYGEALNVNPRNALVLNWLGYAFYRNRQYEDAIATLRRALEVQPKYPEASYNLALALWKDGQREAAAEALKTAFSDPDYEALGRQDPQSRAIREYVSRQR